MEGIKNLNLNLNLKAAEYFYFHVEINTIQYNTITFRGPLSLVRTNEEVFERKVVSPVYKTD
jgi:hypothetical protein